MAKYLSGRVKRKEQSKVAISTDRYRYLGLNETEPNLGDPLSGTFQDTPPAGTRYQIVSVEGYPGERYWIPVEGGIIPGSITVYDESTKLVGNISSITQLNFIGAAITATSDSFKETTLTLSGNHSFSVGLGITQGNNNVTGFVKYSTTTVGYVTVTNVEGSFAQNASDEIYEDGVTTGLTVDSLSSIIETGVKADITVSPQFFSENKELIFNDNGEFNGASVYWDKSNTRLGINSSDPAHTLDVTGDIDVSGSIKVGATIYDSDGDPGTDGQILAKGAGNPGTIDWVRLESIITGAGGTIGNIQFHGTTGLVQGDDELNFNPYNEFIGIGTNDPAQKFQVGVDGKRYTTKKLTLDSAIGDNYSAGDLVQLRTAASPFGLQDIFGTLVYDVPSAGTALTVRNSNYETKGTQWSSFTGNGYRIYFNNTVLATGRYITSVGNDATIPETTYEGDDVFVVTSTGDVGIGTVNPRTKRDSTTVNLDVAGDVLFKGDNNYDLHWDKSAYSLILDDNAKFAAGTDSDLEIYHNGTTGYIENNTGHFYIRNAGSNINSNIYIQARSGENSIICNDDAGIDLYYNNSRKAYTDISGFRIDGRLYVDHSTSEFHGDVIFDGNTAGRDIYFDVSENSLYAYDNAEFRVGTTADLRIYHDSTLTKTYVGLDSSGGKTLDFVSFDNNLGISTAMRVTHVNSGDNYNTYVNLYYNGVEKLEVTENGIDVTGHVETDTLNVSSASTISNIKIGGLGGNLSNTIDTTSGNLIINAQGGSNTIVTDSELQINSTEPTTGNNDGALIVAGGVHIRSDLILCNDPDIVDTIDPVKVGIATRTPVDRLQIGSRNEFIPVVNTNTGDLAAPVGGLGTNEITGITISGSGIVLGQEVKSGFHTVGTKISNIVGNTIIVDTYATNTVAQTNVPITFGIRNDSAVIAIGQTGSVGIGTTSAEAKLDVRGNLQVTGIASVSETIKVGAAVTISSSGDTFISGITSVGTGVTITPSNGGIAVTGIITATGGFIGTVNSSDIVGDITATNINVTEESTDAECNIVFVTASNGILPPKTNANLTYDSSTGKLQSASFEGDGSLLTGVIGVGTGVELQSNGTSVGAAATINFSGGFNVLLSTSSGVATVTPTATDRSVFSHYSDYASHSETSNYAYGIVGIANTSYNEVGILTANSSSADSFGWSVATSADGKTIVVGDRFGDGNATDSGAVYVFDREGNTYSQVGVLTGSYSTDNYDNFGQAVATSADGKTIVVGAFDDETSGTTGYGLVYVYDRVGNDFNEVAILTGSYATESFDYFGWSVATSADGNTIIVGAYGDETSGTTGHGLVYVYDRVGNDFNEVAILTASDQGAGDSFGQDVACSVDGKTIVVGAGGHDDLSGHTSSGAVYVFDRVGDDFNEVGILTAFDSNNYYFFGNEVATSADGKTIFVGRSSISANQPGAVYVYDRVENDFNQVGILTGFYADDDDQFGISVACSADGKTIIVGAQSDEYPGSGNGSGLVYVFNRQGNNFNEVGILTGSYASNTGDYFGHSVATSADGKTIIVGAYNDEINSEQGLVYVFDQNVNTKSLLRTIDEKNIIIESNLTVTGDIKGTADNADRSIFSSYSDYASHSETSNGSYNLVGIGSTYIEVGAIELDNPNSNDEFGHTVATSADGKTIIVGAPDHDTNSLSNVGAVYVFDREGNTYSQVGFFTGSYATSSSDYFGQEIACSADGKTIVVGNQYSELPGSESNSGLVYVFDRVGNDFNEVGILTGSYASQNSDNFGSSVATSADGKTIVVGALLDEKGVDSVDGGGVVYVFDRVGNDFNEVGILTVSSGAFVFDYFGYSVATSADGKTIAVGAYGDESGVTVTDVGAIYVFDRVGNDFNQVGILTASYDTVRYDFGREVAISADGKTIIGSAYYESGTGDPTKGTVHVFDRVGNDFNEVGILTAGTEYADNHDYFGWSVACSADGKTIFVGAPNDEYSSTSTTGIVHVFNRQGNNFNKVGIITGSYATNLADKFGYAVACSADGKSVIASALNDEIGGTSAAGVVYVFDQTTVARDAITATDTGVLITGDLNVTGDITAFYTSDERLKDNITPIDDPLAKVISISGNTFDWNQNSNKSGHDVGVIAQEIKEILPEAVTERDNGYLAVDYYKVIPLLIEAIKELSEDRNIITSKNGVKYRFVVDDDGNLSTEKV